jgi:hypothetical protein
VAIVPPHLTFHLVDEDGGGHLRHGDFHPRIPPGKSTTSRDVNLNLWALG